MHCWPCYASVPIPLLHGSAGLSSWAVLDAFLLPNSRQVDNNAARRSNGTESDWQTLYTGKDVSFDATLRPGRYYVVRVVAKLVEQGASGADPAALQTQTSDGHLFRTIPMAPEDMGPPTQNGGGRNILKVLLPAFVWSCVKQIPANSIMLPRLMEHHGPWSTATAMGCHCCCC
jgi:hypothetical protein